MDSSPRIVISFLAILFSLVLCAESSSPLIRRTSNGPVEGVEKTSSLGQKYYAFRGIPFAEAPITGVDPNTGETVDRRFKAPSALQHTWSEPLEAHDFRDFCIPSMTIPGLPTSSKLSENCLFVNIHVPVGGAKKKTVMVWIHGGGFAMGDVGDTMTGPDFLLSEDNILVTVQYRLGIFGFLNLGFEEYSGNMGLKDQQLALKWVYENIENFSGNKDEILLFGESAGGASVGFHLVNEESRKYFTRAHLISSSILSYYALSEADHLQRMKDYAKIDNNERLLEYLRTEDSSVLAKAFQSTHMPFTYVTFVPTIEDQSSVKPFITKRPEEIYASKNAPVMDAMFSFNSKEGVVFVANLLNRTEPLIGDNALESELELPYDGFDKHSHPEEYKLALEKLREVYFSGVDNIDAIRDANIQLVSDIKFVDSILKSVILQTIKNNEGADETKHKKTFLFRFSVDTEMNHNKILSGLKFKGATHADDLCYVFHCHQYDSLYEKHLKQKDEVFQIIMRMVKMITNFARTGNPSIEGDTPFESCKSPNEVFCQEISNNPESNVTTNIKEQLHYDTWREIDQIYKNLK